MEIEAKEKSKNKKKITKDKKKIRKKRNVNIGKTTAMVLKTIYTHADFINKTKKQQNDMIIFIWDRIRDDCTPLRMYSTTWKKFIKPFSIYIMNIMCRLVLICFATFRFWRGDLPIQVAFVQAINSYFMKKRTYNLFYSIQYNNMYHKIKKHFH